MSLEELQRGRSGDPPSPQGPLRVVLVRDLGARPFMAARDELNRLYALRFDPRDAPELATGAEMVASRVFHAIGYHVPETHLIVLDRAQLVLDNNASDVTSMGQLRELLPQDIDRFLERVARRSNGSYRAVALRVPTEGEALIGPYQFYGTRSDDPNDIVPHEHRRDLRGLHVFSAWLNHTRVGPINTSDVIVQLQGEPLHIRHHLLDFMATLGSGLTGPKPIWEGHDPIYARDSTIQNIAGLGLYTPAWMRASYPDLPAVGRFESETFDPDTWTPLYDLAPFANRLPDDTFWAARLVMAFTDDDIRAIVRTAEYSDQNAERWIADCLIERRNRIGRAYFDKVLPLVGFAVRNDTLVFEDLADRPWVRRSHARTASEWSMFDNAAGKPSKRIGAGGESTLVSPEAMNAPDGGYVLARDHRGAWRPGLAVNGVLAEGVGRPARRRHRPGVARTALVDPRVSARPVRNRYVELEPERQKLFEHTRRS